MTTTPPRLPFRRNTLYYGDCLDVVRKWPEGRVDLIYLDPPFKKKRRYNLTVGAKNGAKAQAVAFENTWTWGEAAAARVAQLKGAVAHPAHKAIIGFEAALGEGFMLAYLSYMAERLAEMKPLLKESGSIWLHCDPDASHYLKILMDGIFGERNFRNEIVWCYTGPGNTTKWLPRKHDVILFYSKNHEEQRPLSLDDIRIPYKQLNPQHSAGSGKSGGIGGKLDKDSIDTYQKKGKTPEDYWLEGRDGMSPVGRLAKERLGYSTQKPRALLERIIRICTRKGDLVLDPFVGTGTTVHAARSLKRHWIGIDISPVLIRMVQGHLQKARRGASVPVHGMPTDMDGAEDLLAHDHAAFEAWMVTAIPGMAPNEVKVSDGGIDGRGAVFDDTQPSRLVIAQVKGGGYSASALRDFMGVMARKNALAGVFVTLKRTKTKSALAKAAGLGEIKIGGSSYPKLQFWSTEELLEGLPPNLPTMADPYTGEQA